MVSFTFSSFKAWILIEFINIYIFFSQNSELEFLICTLCYISIVSNVNQGSSCVKDIHYKRLHLSLINGNRTKEFVINL